MTWNIEEYDKNDHFLLQGTSKKEGIIPIL